MTNQTFSHSLQKWLDSSSHKSLNGLIKHFAEKSFAILFLILMAVPALPIPTGGVTHLFEIITALLALELIAGRKTVWLPHKWLSRTLPKTMQDKALPSLIKIIKKLESISKPRQAGLLVNTLTLRIIGLIVLIFTVFAFISVPFSGLDTLPALGVVLISLGIILEDILIVILGSLVGAIGVALVLTIGTVALKLLG